MTTTRTRCRIARAAASAALASLFVAGARAEEVVVKLDPARTEIDYTLGATLHTVHGTFRLTSGEIRFDLATGAAGGAVVVDAASGQSGSQGRDRRMHKEILESGKYPEIRFIPVRVQGQLAAQGSSEMTIEGNFDLHGASHPITVTTLVERTGDQLTAKIHFPIPYVAWGLKNPSTFFLRVSDKVNIDLSATGRLETAATSAP